MYNSVAVFVNHVSGMFCNKFVTLSIVTVDRGLPRVVIGCCFLVNELFKSYKPRGLFLHENTVYADTFFSVTQA